LTFKRFAGDSTSKAPFFQPLRVKKNFIRSFHSSTILLVYPDVNSEFDPVNTEQLSKDTSENKSKTLDKDLDDNKGQSKQVREDLRNHLKTLDRLSKSRVSNARAIDDTFNNHINDEEKRVQKVHKNAYLDSSNEKPWYEDKINENAMSKSLFAVNKSEYSAEIMKTNITEEEKETREAVKGLTKDLYQLRDNRFDLMRLKKENTEKSDLSRDNKPSLLDDYADLSTEMADYTGGDD